MSVQRYTFEFRRPGGDWIWAYDEPSTADWNEAQVRLAELSATEPPREWRLQPSEPEQA